MMMLPLVMAATVNAASPTIVTNDQLPGLFIAACLDGTARTTGAATPIEFDALPSDLRMRLGKPYKAQVWKLNGVDKSYLYSLSYRDRSFSPRICGVASDGLVLRPASAAVESRLRGGAPSAGSYKPIEWINEAAGYRALATRKGAYTILQVNWLKEEAVRTE
jgi:hypothetical protein